MALSDLKKDVYSINEVAAINRLLQGINDFLIDTEGNEIRVEKALFEVRDRDGLLIGSFTKYTDAEDIKFEPNFGLDV